MIVAGCTTGAGTGAYAGSTLGALLGSAIGGIAGGPRGSDIGTLVGMAGGAAVGGALGAQADKQQQEQQRYEDARFEQKYDEHRRAATAGNDGYGGQAYYGHEDAGYESYAPDDSGFDPTNSGDDVLYDFNGSDYTGNYTAARPEHVVPSAEYDEIGTPAKVADRLPLEVRNARFVDDNQDRRLGAGELSKVIFEIYNVSGSTVYDVQPMVVETTGNRRIYVSNSIHVERIVPGKGVRYTAMVKGDRKLKDGTACFRVYAVQGNGDVVSNVSEFNIATARR